MNRNIVILLLLIAAFAGISSCKKENACDCFKGTGSLITETRTLPAFQKISVEDNVNVIFTQDSVQQITVEAGKHLIALVKTEVVDGELRIRNDNRCNFMRRYNIPVNVYVHAPKTMYYISTKSTGKVSSTNDYTGDSLHLEIKGGSGDIEFFVNSPNVYTHQHGAGDIILHGHADNLIIYNVAVGYTTADDCTSNYCWIWQKTVGTIKVNVRDLLDVTITSRGNVYYKGSPQVNQQLESTGEVLPL